MTFKINNEEYHFDGYVYPINSIQKIAEKCYEQGREDERKNVLDDVLEIISFEEKWLLDALHKDKLISFRNIYIAFDGLKGKVNKLKEQSNG